MRFRTTILISVLLAAAGLAQAAEETPLLANSPTVSKTLVVFAYGGYLWSVPREGGDARQLSTGGHEDVPVFSPDGKWIAFTGQYDGNPDVYVMSAEGGEPKRLTFHPSNDIVLGWTPDGKNILFRSDRFSAPPGRYTKLFLASPQGGPAKPLQVPRASLTSFSPDAPRSRIPKLRRNSARG